MSDEIFLNISGAIDPTAARYEEETLPTNSLPKKPWFGNFFDKYFSYVSGNADPRFTAVILLHADYTPSETTTTPETTIYPNTNRKVVNIAPLGSSWVGHQTRSGYMLNMILIAKINPIVAAQYAYPIDYMKTDQHAVMGANIRRGERKICNRTDELYEVYKSSPRVPSQIKHYQNELPKFIKPVLDVSNEIDSVNDGYALFNKDTGLTGYIGYVYRHEMGYFLLNSIEIVFDDDIFSILTTILYYLNKVVERDDFAKLSTPVLQTDEKTGKRTYLVKYPRKFNMGQCKYFIAYMLLKTDRRLAELCRVGECERYIENILKRHVGYNPEDSKYFISEYNTEFSTGYYPFLIRTFDYNVPQADMLLQYYTKLDPAKDASIENIIFFPQDDPNMKRLRDIPISALDSKYIKMNPKIGNEFLLDNLLYTKSFDRNNYKLTLLEFSEEDIMKFIGNINNVTEYVFTCSGVHINENATSEEIHRYFELSKELGRGRKTTKKKNKKKRKTRKKKN